MLLGISRSLQQHLLASIPNSASSDWVVIGALQHDEPLNLPTGKLVVFLYAIEENPFLRNRPPVANDAGDFVPAPLALTLQYMITYVSAEATDVQEWLTEVLRVFSSSPRLGPAQLHTDLHGVVDQLVVRLRTPSVEELNRLWTALNVGMRLALFYEVDAALIPATDPETVGPVERRRLILTGDPAA
jgi:hypothetical protein